MKLIKKSVMTATAVSAVAAMIFGRDAISYVSTAFRGVQDAVKSEVPVEFEVERARDLVAQLVPDIRKCMHKIAEQQVDVESRQLQLSEKEASLNKQKEVILAMQNDLSNGKGEYVYAGLSYTSAEVKQDLERRFDRYKAAESVLMSDKKILEARRQTLAANTQRLSDLNEAKMDLQVKIEQLEARAQTVAAAESVSSLAIDDSSLSQAAKLIEDLNRQLDVKERVMDAEAKFADLIPVEQKRDDAEGDISRQIELHFGLAPKSAAVAKSK
ncbi:MAG: hypothetical protein U0996_25450 [Planctomycetaceae bacterium]